MFKPTDLKSNGMIFFLHRLFKFKWGVDYVLLVSGTIRFSLFVVALHAQSFPNENVQTHRIVAASVAHI